MTQMEAALVEAGVPVPTVNERLWNAVKESGKTGVTSQDLIRRMAALGPQAIYAAMSNMEKRGMIYRTEEPRAHVFGAGQRKFRYYTDMDTYKLLPITARGKPGKKAKRGTVTQPSAQQALPFDAPPPPPKPAPAGTPMEIAYPANIEAVFDAMSVIGHPLRGLLRQPLGDVLVALSAKGAAVSIKFGGRG